MKWKQWPQVVERRGRLHLVKAGVYTLNQPRSKTIISSQSVNTQRGRKSYRQAVILKRWSNLSFYSYSIWCTCAWIPHVLKTCGHGCLRLTSCTLRLQFHIQYPSTYCYSVSSSNACTNLYCNRIPCCRPKKDVAHVLQGTSEALKEWPHLVKNFRNTFYTLEGGITTDRWNNQTTLKAMISACRKLSSWLLLTEPDCVETFGLVSEKVSARSHVWFYSSMHVLCGRPYFLLI